MSTISQSTGLYNSGGTQGYVVTWANMSTGDDGEAVEKFGAADRSIQVTGTFGGATVTLQGSNDNVNWATLHDPQGVALSLTTGTNILAVSEATRYMRPIVTGGAATVSVILFGGLR